MSDARAASMASISAALDTSSPLSGGSAPDRSAADDESIPIPPPPPLALLTKSATEQAEAKVKADKAARGESVQDEEEREQNKHDQAEQKESNALGEIAGAARQTATRAGDIVRDAQVSLEELPQPGSLALPIILLLLFFLALIPVNGYPRIYWLWLVITRNAVLAGEPQPPTIPVGTSGSGPAQQPGAAEMQVSIPEPPPAEESYRL